MRFLSMVAVVASVALAACGSGDKSDVAPAEPEVRSSPTAKPDETGVFDIEAGQCFTSLGDTVEDEVDGIGRYESLHIVPCDAPNAEGRIDRFEQITRAGEREGDWPGDDVLEGIAARECVYSSALTYLYPSPTSWDDGDREIVCMTLFAYEYAVGACVSGDDDAPIVPCDHPDAVDEITALIDVSADHPEGASYPGEGYFDDVWLDECPEGDDAYLYPTQTTWPLGDRELICLAGL